MESLEHAWDVKHEQRQWPFLADPTRHYSCPACRTAVTLQTDPNGHTYFVHVQTNCLCQRFRGTPNLNAEAKYLLLLALSICKHVTIRKRCLRCNSLPISVNYSYDTVLDPLGSGVNLPADYVDDGADLLLYQNGQKIVSFTFSDLGLKNPKGSTLYQLCQLASADAIGAAA